MSEKRVRVKFGNWLPTSPTTVGGLTLMGWGCVVTSVMLMVGSFVLGRFLAGFLLMLLGLFLTVLFVVRFGPLDAGRTISSRLWEKATQIGRVARGEAQYRTGIFSALPSGKLSALPGPLADVEEVSGIDGMGLPYTLLHHKAVKQVAATMTCVPDGIGLLHG